MLVIGDIHGCYNELQDLLDKSGIGDDTPILAVGDLYDKGPQPRRVFEFFAEHPAAQSVRGNHEQRHRTMQKQSWRAKPYPAQAITRLKMGKHYPQLRDQIKKMNFLYEDEQVRVAHAFYNWKKSSKKQKNALLAGEDSAQKPFLRQYGKQWYLHYDDDKPLIVGHKKYGKKNEPFIYKDRFYGIDTRCVYGGALTGIVLPEWRIVSVPSRDNHWSYMLSRRKWI